MSERETNEYVFAICIKLEYILLLIVVLVFVFFL